MRRFLPLMGAVRMQQAPHDKVGYARYRGKMRHFAREPFDPAAMADVFAGQRLERAFRNLPGVDARRQRAGERFRSCEGLVRERQRVLSKDELAAHLYPHDEERDSNVIEVLIARLRRKLDPDGSLQPLETLRGRGYRFTLGDGQ